MLYFLAALTILVSISRPASCLGGRDDWTAIGLLSIFQDLDACSQNCLLNVSSKLIDPDKDWPCESWGCVCSGGNSIGQNYQDGRWDITQCVQGSCGDQQGLVDQVADTFDEICLNQSLSVAGTNESESNGELTLAVGEICHIPSSLCFRNVPSVRERWLCCIDLLREISAQWLHGNARSNQ
jgi:hypothetical protein